MGLKQDVVLNRGLQRGSKIINIFFGFLIFFLSLAVWNWLEISQMLLNVYDAV